MPIYDYDEVQIIERKPYWTIGRILLFVCLTPVFLVVFFFTQAFLSGVIEQWYPQWKGWQSLWST